MNQDTLKGECLQLKGRVRKVLLGRLKERYEHTREEVEREFDAWFAKPRG